MDNLGRKWAVLLIKGSYEVRSSNIFDSLDGANGMAIRLATEYPAEVYGVFELVQYAVAPIPEPQFYYPVSYAENETVPVGGP